MLQSIANMLVDLEILIQRSREYFGRFRVDRRLSPANQADRTSALAALMVARGHCQQLRVHSLDPISLLDLVSTLERAWGWGHIRPYRRNRGLSRGNQAKQVRAMTGLEMAVGLAKRLKAWLDPLPWHALLDAAPSPPVEAPTEEPWEPAGVEPEEPEMEREEHGERHYSIASLCYNTDVTLGANPL
jgi:hypothetical protein